MSPSKGISGIVWEMKVVTDVDDHISSCQVCVYSEHSLHPGSHWGLRGPCQLEPARPQRIPEPGKTHGGLS